MEELLETFAKLAAHIYNTFDFYAVMGSGTDVTQIQLNQFTDLLDDCEIVEKDRVECNRAAMDSIFVVTNREDDQEEDTADANDDRALMRFEFLEILVRIAAAKYIDTKRMTNLSDALFKLLHNHFKDNEGEGSCNALIDDPTIFRKDLLYKEEIDRLLRRNMEMLSRMYAAYCENVGMGMTLRNFTDMLKDIGFINRDFTQREARLAFVWSKSRVIDEVEGRDKIFHANYYDFMESHCKGCSAEAHAIS